MITLSQATKSLAGIKSADRILVHSLPGVGKTSLGCYFPNTLFLMPPLETGLLTLMKMGRVDHTNNLVLGTDFGDLKNVLLELATKDHPYKTVVLDTINGFADLLKESIIKNSFAGNREKAEEYGRINKFMYAEWKDLIARLDAVNRRGIRILLLNHSTTKSTKNPGGEDWLKHVPLLADGLWEPLNAWLDMVLFLQRRPKLKKAGLSNKVDKTASSQLFFVAFDDGTCEAKHRHGLPNEMGLPNDPRKIYPLLQALIDKNQTIPTDNEPAEEVEEEAVEAEAAVEEEVAPEPTPAVKPAVATAKLTTTPASNGKTPQPVLVGAGKKT